MPTQIVDVDLQTETGAIAQQTYSDLLVIARDPDVVDPTYNVPNVYDSPAQVGSDFGTDSDAYASAEEIADRRTRQWWVLMLDSSSHSETVGNSDSESTDEGEVANTPMRGGEANTTVTLDGAEQDLVFTTASPPEKPDTGEAAINAATGEIVTGSSSDGADTGIVVDYETLSFDDARPEVEAGDFDLMILADTHVDRSHIGELDEVLSWASAEDASVVAAYKNGDEYDTDEDAMAAAHDIGGFATSGNLLPIAHKSSDEVAAGVAGRLATKRPWFNPYMDGGADYTFAMGQYRKALIGSPDSPGTFEGGDQNGEGPTNVLYTEMGTQILSNSLSTAGAESNYQFFDVSRTESFIVSEITNALRGLRLRRESIPFAPIGRTLIEATLRGRLNQYVAPSGRALSQEEIALQGEDGEEEAPAFTFQGQRERRNHSANVPLSEVDIHVPRYDDLSQTDRANRVWSGIQITAQLAGNAHTFGVELAVQV